MVLASNKGKYSSMNCIAIAEREHPLKKLIDRLNIPPYLFLSREDDDDVRDIRKHDFRSVLLHPCYLMLIYLQSVVEWNSEKPKKSLASAQGAGFESRTFTCKSSMHTTRPRVQHESKKLHEMRCNKDIYPSTPKCPTFVLV